MSEEVQFISQEDQLRHQLAFANGCIDELKSLVNKLKAYNESQDRFWQAFCASLSGYRANPKFARKKLNRSLVVIDSKNVIPKCIEDAKEAVRQVGGLKEHEEFKLWENATISDGLDQDKEQARDS